MNTRYTDLEDEVSDAHSQAEAYCQSLVDTGEAQWRVNDAGYTELYIAGGETYLFGEFGVARLK